MRNIYGILALTLVVACGGSDGKDGRDGAMGATGPAGPSGADGQDGDDGEPGMDGMDGMDGAPGANGTNGADGADGSIILQGSGAPAAGDGADGDLYIDTVSRDVYRKENGAWTLITNLSGGPPGPKGDDGAQGDPGDDGADGSSVLTGSGAPAAGLGNEGDVYIDSATGDLYAKGAGGWAVSGSLKGPAGADGADGADGVDVEDTLAGLRWFAFALDASFNDETDTLLTSQTYTPTSSAATFDFAAANQHGRLSFFTTNSFLQGGVNWIAFDYLKITAAVTGGATSAVQLYLLDGDNIFCEWDTTAAAGPDYTFDLWAPSSCTNGSGAAEDWSPASVTAVQLGIRSSMAGSRTLTVTDISLIPN